MGKQTFFGAGVNTAVDLESWMRNSGLVSEAAVTLRFLFNKTRQNIVIHGYIHTGRGVKHFEKS